MVEVDLFRILYERAVLKLGGVVRRALIVGGDSDFVLEGLQDGYDLGLILPVIIGPGKSIEERISRLGLTFEYDLVDASSESEIASYCTELCSIGDTGGGFDMVVKGHIHTDEFMRSLLNRASGMRIGKILTHIFYLVSPRFGCSYYLSDCALNILAEGVIGENILSNLVDLAYRVEGVEPYVSILSASEVINSGIASSVEADRLKCWSMDNLPLNFAERIYGPLALDSAISSVSASVKGLSDIVSAGCSNALLVPSIESGNVLFKSMVYFGDFLAAGVVSGARLPIVLTSRSDSRTSRLASLALAIASESS